MGLGKGERQRGDVSKEVQKGRRALRASSAEPKAEPHTFPMPSPAPEVLRDPQRYVTGTLKMTMLVLTGCTPCYERLRPGTWGIRKPLPCPGISYLVWGPESKYPKAKGQKRDLPKVLPLHNEPKFKHLQIGTIQGTM